MSPDNLSPPAKKPTLKQKMVEGIPKLPISGDVAAYERVLGALTIDFSYMHFYLEHFAWQAWGVAEDQGKIITQDLRTSHLIKQIKDSIDCLKCNKEDSDALRQLLAKMEKAAERRNELLHSLWIIQEGAPVFCMSRKRGVLIAGDVPTISGLEDFSILLLRLTRDLFELSKKILKKPLIFNIGLAPLAPAQEAASQTPDPISGNQRRPVGT